MTDRRETWYDARTGACVVVADATSAAKALARGHLCGPTSAYFLAKAVACVAALGAETSEGDEVVSAQMKCDGPLGGFNVECTAAGGLRGYTERKILDDFDGMGRPDERKAVGASRLQVTRSVPGRIVSQSVAASFDDYLQTSLQRKAAIAAEASVDDGGDVLLARAVLFEAMPDSALAKGGGPLPEFPANLAVSSRALMVKLGLANAELKSSVPLAFACRCSPERASAMVAALPEDERRAMPPVADVTCHMCGRTYSVCVR